MRKALAPATIFFIYLFTYPLIGYADDISTSTVEAAPAFHLSDQQMEKILQSGEVTLKKIKIGHHLEDRKQHRIITEKAYQEALVLYNQKRDAQAKDALGHVEHLTDYYKSSDKILKMIENQSVQQLRLEILKTRKMQELPLVINLSQRASSLDQQVANLGDDKVFFKLKKKIARLNDVLLHLKEEKKKIVPELSTEVYLNQNMNQIKQKANIFDQQVAALTKAGKYALAEKKLQEFQVTIANDLAQLKHASGNAKAYVERAETQDRILQEKGYRDQEKAMFNQALDLYRKGLFLEAKSIFDELASQGNKRAQAYSAKIDRLLRQ